MALDASYKDAQDRLATVRVRLKETAATATAVANAQTARAKRMQALLRKPLPQRRNRFWRLTTSGV